MHRVLIASLTMDPDYGMIRSRVDDKWLKKLVRGKDTIKHDQIQKWLSELGLLCRINGGDYMYVDTANYWYHLASSEAMARLNVIVETHNVSVNIADSVKQFYKGIVKRCNTNIGKMIPTSVCIGIERLEVQFDESNHTITFTPCRALVKIDPKSDPIVGAACIMPIDTILIPDIYRFPGKGDIIAELAKLFPDIRRYTTVLWIIGNCLIDPPTKPKCLMLSGPGGSGKSTMLQQVNNCLLGCSGILPDGCLTSDAKSMPPEVSSVVAGCRIGLCYDVDFDRDPLNMSIYKNISGSDYVRVGHASVKSNCSLMLATNGVVNIEAQREYLNDSIMRRTVSVLMNTSAMKIKDSIIPEDLESRLDFACACIYIRMQYDEMPIVPYDVLLTICQSKIDEVMSYVEETIDPPSILNALAVVDIISGILRISNDDLIFKASIISPMSVVKIGNYEVLKNLTIRK